MIQRSANENAPTVNTQMTEVSNSSVEADAIRGTLSHYFLVHWTVHIAYNYCNINYKQLFVCVHVRARVCGCVGVCMCVCVVAFVCIMFTRMFGLHWQEQFFKCESRNSKDLYAVAV